MILKKPYWKGYILEELVARLLQTAGYRLITSASHDPIALTANKDGDLRVRGRGADHQVDVLGEFGFAPAFTNPVRLFVEAKSYAATRRVALPSVRNAFGTVADVNQGAFAPPQALLQRFDYRYALFSTSGFTKPAQLYAITHQIVLVDLSGPEWQWLRKLTDDLADWAAQNQAVPGFSIQVLRALLRQVLGTSDEPVASDDAPSEWISAHLGGTVRMLLEDASGSFTDAVLVLPAGSQAVIARPDSLDRFLRYCAENPTHEVTLLRRAGTDQTISWTVRPAARPDAYALHMTAPQRVAEVSARSGRRRMQQQPGGETGQFDIIWDPPSSVTGDIEGPRVFRLVYNPEALNS